MTSSTARMSAAMNSRIASIVTERDLRSKGGWMIPAKRAHRRSGRALLSL